MRSAMFPRLSLNAARTAKSGLVGVRRAGGCQSMGQAPASDSSPVSGAAIGTLASEGKRVFGTASDPVRSDDCLVRHLANSPIGGNGGLGAVQIGSVYCCVCDVCMKAMA